MGCQTVEMSKSWNLSQISREIISRDAYPLCESEQSFKKSLKTTWTRKYLDTSNHVKWKEFVELHLERCGGNLIFRGQS